ncbi:hypothetical protein [Streptomyces sp. SID11385]|uniref:hypothetical protein n=1 Tax=Streptomyces sp. SID11385 TaxID=2706031 RepID=UPI0013CCEAC2|nr:hypothetical protein [Streptomyces sp. SID11385]NEA39315.1 hypothetical protein [Streptomyces sp. SID11385]
MKYRCAKLSAGAATAVAAVLLSGTAPADAAVLPGVTFYTGVKQTGTAFQATLDDGACHELPAASLSFSAISETGVDVFFNAGCATGSPGTHGDLYYRTGTLGQGNFPFPAVSYRVHTGG